jgi:hypothetical protein
MLFADLKPLTQLSGIFASLSVFIAWLYGIIVLYKAIKLKEKRLFYFFFAIIFTMSPWYPSGLGYIYWLITNNEIAYPIYVLLGTVGVPIALYSWLQIYMPALHPKYKNIITLITICLSIALYFYVATFLFIVPDGPIEDLIGIKRNYIDIDYKGFVLVFLAFSVLISTITGNDFAISSLKNKEDRVFIWKGRFLLLSFNLFAIGAIGDGFIELSAITLIIFRTFMMLASTFYYIGFIMPKWMMKILKLK